MARSSNPRRTVGPSNPARPVPPPPQRVYPPVGEHLTLDVIRGLWWPSSYIDACGMFAVAWVADRGLFWAPLHDFAPADQRRMIEACRELDVFANGPEGSREVRRP